MGIALIMQYHYFALSDSADLKNAPLFHVFFQASHCRVNHEPGSY